ncbi:MAG: hypothetical protein PVJ19_00815 [Desulfobacteraceae bacterium]|jgi:hypothetical protein
MEGENKYYVGSILQIKLDIKNELFRYEPSEFSELELGSWLLMIKGVIWLHNGIEYFLLKKNVEITTEPVASQRTAKTTQPVSHAGVPMPYEPIYKVIRTPARLKMYYELYGKVLVTAVQLERGLIK